MGTALSEHLVIGSSLHTFFGTFSQDSLASSQHFSRGSSQHFCTPFTLTHSFSVTVVHCLSVTILQTSSSSVLHSRLYVVLQSCSSFVLVTGFLTISQTFSSLSKHFCSWSKTHLFLVTYSTLVSAEDSHTWSSINSHSSLLTVLHT